MGEIFDEVFDARLNQLVEDYVLQTADLVRVSFNPSDYRTGRAILALDAASAARVVCWLLDGRFQSHSIKSLFSALLRKPLPITCETFAAGLCKSAVGQYWESWHWIPYRGLLRAIARRIKQSGLTLETRKSLEQFRAWLPRVGRHSSEPRACAHMIDIMLGDAPAAPPLAVMPGEAWSWPLYPIWLRCPRPSGWCGRNCWTTLELHAARPTKKWLTGRAAGGRHRTETLRELPQWFAIFSRLAARRCRRRGNGMPIRIF